MSDKDLDLDPLWEPVEVLEDQRCWVSGAAEFSMQPAADYLDYLDSCMMLHKRMLLQQSTLDVMKARIKVSAAEEESDGRRQAVLFLFFQLFSWKKADVVIRLMWCLKEVGEAEVPTYITPSK